MSSNSTRVSPGDAAAAADSSTPCCGTSTLFAFLAASFALSFFLIFLYICLRYLRRRRHRTLFILQEEEQQQPLPAPPPPMLGLDDAAIALLPSFPYLRPDGETSTSVECAVCLNAVDEGEMVRQLPSCGHLFHQDCIDVWLSSNASCPVCRSKAEPAPTRGAEGIAGRPAATPVVVPVEMLNDEMVAAEPACSQLETDLERQ